MIKPAHVGFKNWRVFMLGKSAFVCSIELVIEVFRTDSITNRIYMKPLLLLILLVAACKAEPHLPSGTKALPSAAEKGRGPLALVNLNHHVLGHARVFGGREPDLFVAGYGGPQAGDLF